MTAERRGGNVGAWRVCQGQSKKVLAPGEKVRRGRLHSLRWGDGGPIPSSGWRRTARPPLEQPENQRL